MQICSINCHCVLASTGYLVTISYFIFLFCRAVVRAVSLLPPVPLFLSIAVLYGLSVEQIKIDRDRFIYHSSTAISFDILGAEMKRFSHVNCALSMSILYETAVSTVFKLQPTSISVF